jgi:hypothetical protein
MVFAPVGSQQVQVVLNQPERPHDVEPRHSVHTLHRWPVVFMAERDHDVGSRPQHMDVGRPMLAGRQVDHDPEWTAAQDDRHGA